MPWHNPFGRQPADPPAQMVQEAPGFYGKVPALGDFLSRRMPPKFAGSWDAWLQSLIESSRSRLGAGWPDAWLEMPIWHFGLGAGVAGPGKAFGVLIPSVDRVGRHFPFTIFGMEQPGGVPLAEWALQIEALALGALDDDFKPKSLEDTLSGLGCPSARTQADGLPAEQAIQLIEPSDWPTPVDQIAATLGRGETMWWCRGSGLVPAIMLRLPGLPPIRLSGCFVAGGFPD